MVITRSAAKKQEEKKIVSDLIRRVIIESQETFTSDKCEIANDSVSQVDNIVSEEEKEDSSNPEEESSVSEDESSVSEEEASAPEEDEGEDEEEKDLMNKQNENDNAKLYYLASVLFSSILMFYMVLSNYKCYYFK